MRKTRGKLKDTAYYIASSIVYKNDNKEGIYGFRLYDMQYDDYTIFTLTAIKNLLNKHPNCIVNVKIRDGYTGLLYVSSNNYSGFNKNGQLISKGNKILFKRHGVNQYTIIDEDGVIKDVDIREIKNWISPNVLISKDKDNLMNILKSDIEFFNSKYDAFTRKNELLTLTGNNYLVTEIKILDNANKERVIRVSNVREDCTIPNGIVKIPKEVSVVKLNLASRDDIKVLDFRYADNLKRVDLDINKCNLKILFPNYEIDHVSIVAHEGVLEFQNLEKTKLFGFELNTIELRNEKLNLSFYNYDVCACKLSRVSVLKELKIKSDHTFSEKYFRVEYCNDLEVLDCSELRFNNVSNSMVSNCIGLRHYKVRLDNGYFYGVCGQCKNLEELELYGNAIQLNETSITYITPLLRKLRMDMTVINVGYRPCFIANGYILKEIINNSNVKTENLFSEEYYRVCELCNANDKLRDVYKRISLDPVYKNDEIIGFKAVRYLGFDNAENDEYNKLLKEGILNIPKEIIEISNRAFNNQSKIKRIIFNGPVRINRDAFKSCSNLECIENSEYITYMGENAFAFCSKLKEFKCGDKLDKINLGVFMGCLSLENLYISESVKELDRYSLFCCMELKLSGSMNFKFDSLTVLNKNSIFKLTNSEIGELAAYISSSSSFVLSDIVKFEEIKTLDKIGNDKLCRIKIRELSYDSRDYENLLKLIDGWNLYKRGNIDKIKINMGKQTKDSLSFYNGKQNYTYLVLAKQMNNVLKKLESDDNMINILNSL